MVGAPYILKRVFALALLTMLFSVSVDQLFDHVLIPAQASFSNVKKIERLIQNDDPAEIPVFGSSIARRGYYCEAIDERCFNYGMAGSLYGSVHPLLQIHLDKESNAPLILDFDQHTFLHSDVMKVALSNFVPHVDNPYIASMLEFYGKEDWQHKVPGFRYYGLYTDYIRDLLKPSLEKEELISKGGVFYPPNEQTFEQFLIKRKTMIADKAELDRIVANNGLAHLTEQEKKWRDYLDAILSFHADPLMVEKFESLLKENRDRTFIMVYSPQSEIKLEGLPNYDEVLAFLDGLKASHPNLLVLDYSLAGFENKYYWDSGHMNIDGAKRFSTMLAGDLREGGFID